MQENPLQQLRDVHLPLEPGWWPPAPGWWILASACAAAILYLGTNMWRAHQRKRPIRSARALLEERLSDYRLGQIGALEYVNHANEILKRLLVIAFDIKSLAATSNEDWLGALDRISNSTDFSQNYGSVLGHARFAPAVTTDIEALHQCISNVLNRAHPTKTPLLFMEDTYD